MKLIANSKRIVALILATVTMVSLASCGERTKTEPSEELKSTIPIYINTLTEPELKKPDLPVAPEPALLEKLNAEYAKNSDVIGWLNVPGTKINEAVVQGEDNVFYERRTLAKKQDILGCYFADFENTFGDRNALSKNTIIYGHSDYDDNPNGPKFSELKKYLDPEFAKKNPYIYLTTPEDTMTWEVFSVFYTEKNLPYYYTFDKETMEKYELDADKQYSAILSEIQTRNQYVYQDIKPVTNKDKILTLSTCTYKFGKPKEDVARFIIMARLVPSSEELKESATLTKNESPKAPQVKK